MAPTKSKIILLANCTREHQHTPQLTLDNVAISHKHSTQILGVTYDTSLSFKDHIHDIKQKCTHRLNTLRTLTGTDFGQHTSARFWNTRVLLGPKPCNSSPQHPTHCTEHRSRNNHWLHRNYTNNPPTSRNTCTYSHYKTILTCEGHNF